MTKKMNEYILENWEQVNDNDGHRHDVLTYQEETPVVFIVQNHISNLRHTYGDDALRDVISLLGLDKDESKKVA